MTSAFYALGENAKACINVKASMSEELEPQDAVEAMLVTQITATNVAIAMMTKRPLDADHPQLREG